MFAILTSPMIEQYTFYYERRFIMFTIGIKSIFGNKEIEKVQNSIEDKSIERLDIDDLNERLLRSNERLMKNFTEILKNM